MRNAKLRRAQRNAAVQRHHLPLVQHRGDLKCLVLAALLHHAVRHFQYDDGGHHEARDVFNRRRELAGLWSTGKLFKPRGGIDQIHAIRISRERSVQSLQKAPHLPHGPHRYQLDPILILQRLNLLPPFQSERFADRAWNDHVKLGRDCDD